MATAPAEEIKGGRLSDVSREAARTAAFELLGTYFSGSATWDLEHRRQVIAGDPATEDLAEAIRIRVALSAARRLDDLLRRIVERLTFRYGREVEEVVGAVRGRLDVPRYLRARSRTEVPRRYPVRVLRRHHRTPENVLAMYAAGWVVHEIGNLRIDDILPAGSPERLELVERRGSLLRTLNHPVLAPAAEEAEIVWKRGALERLLDSTVARLDGGHLAAPEPYRELVEWVRRFDPRASSPGEQIEWSVYGSRFDPTLFEIWMLHQIAAALTRKLGPPAERRPLWQRGPAPTYTWKIAGSSLSLHFHMSLSGVRPPRWHWADTGKDLAGIPDVTALISAPASPARAALVDAKLRRREKDPVEELYKLLGYFHNRGDEERPCGAIVAYSPGELRSHELRDDGDGRVLSLGVDPARGVEDGAAFDALAALLVDLLDEVDPGARAFAAAGPAGEEALSLIQERVVEALLDKARALPPDSLDPFRRLLEGQLPSIWSALEPELQTMLISAEYFGSTAPDGADQSGAVLGLGAACERLLCGDGGLMKRMKEALPGLVRSPTLGSVKLVHKARRPHNAEGRAIRAFLVDQVDAGIDDLCALASDLQRLNGHRIAAAHTEVIDRERWQTCRGLVLGHGDEDRVGLLARLVAVRAPTAA